ncbi:hypothetical protein MUO32_10600, partial [Shinella sp. CPCC 101442]|nr:hypothetical protein [Shinella sp. CPCC 101442]
CFLSRYVFLWYGPATIPNGDLNHHDRRPNKTHYLADECDRKVCRGRNVIERLFCKLKHWRRLATSYLAAAALVSSMIAWI